MKATIKKTDYVKSFTSKYGELFVHKIWYDDKVGFYNSKLQDQKKFVAGQEAEFTEEHKTGNRGDYIVIKPATNFGKRESNFGKSLNREQARYSGFSLSYAKDLAVAGLIDKDQIIEYSGVFHSHMVDLDKSLES